MYRFCGKVLFVGDKTRNIIIRPVLRQCRNASCSFLLPVSPFLNRSVRHILALFYSICFFCFSFLFIVSTNLIYLLTRPTTNYGPCWTKPWTSVRKALVWLETCTVHLLEPWNFQDQDVHVETWTKSFVDKMPWNSEAFYLWPDHAKKNEDKT